MRFDALTRVRRPEGFPLAGQDRASPLNLGEHARLYYVI